MIQYHFSIPNPESQYIHIRCEFDSDKEIEQIHFPSWRPGRYELGNFAKNVKSFKVFTSENKALKFGKTDKSTWIVHTENATRIRVEYQYYANELNAGSTYLSPEQLYVNPVNCCVFVAGKESLPCQVNLNIPENYQIACGLPQEDKQLKAANFDALADSPFICSPSMQHAEYTVGATQFNLWFQGEVQVEWEKLLVDFKGFTSKQLQKFSEFPVPEYHFFFQIVPYKAYHGVEHSTSTVILLGPSHAVFNTFYKELLGVSSHELYHTWNVKAIRPIEMFPYDFTRENYSRLGFLCEGVTTYMGDLFLYKSGVFNFDQYVIELKAQLQKHFDNFARFNYSVAESSFDTWLDGYVPGAPNRKVSIYTEGCLLAFVTDCFILKHSKEKHNLDDVMKSLYYSFYLKGKGVSENDYKEIVEQFAGESFDEIYTNFFFGKQPFESILMDAFDYLGLEMTLIPAAKYSHARLGFKAVWQENAFVVKAIYPGSPAELAGMMLEDEILAVNKFKCGAEFEEWLQHFDSVPKSIQAWRKGQLVEFNFPEVNRNFYSEYSIVPVSNPINGQVRAFEAWSK